MTGQEGKRRGMMYSGLDAILYGDLPEFRQVEALLVKVWKSGGDPKIHEAYKIALDGLIKAAMKKDERQRPQYN